MIMGFHHVLQTSQFIFLTLLVAAATSSLSYATNFTIAKPGCDDRCGDVLIPFPFGMTPGCYQSDSFLITCNQTSTPHKPFLHNTSAEITDIAIDGQLRLLQYIAFHCLDPKPNSIRSCTYNSSRENISHGDAWINLPASLTVNNGANKLTIVGCDTFGFVKGLRLNRNYTTGCTAMCDSVDDLTQGSCAGLGCCQTSIPKDVWRVELSLGSYENYSYVRSFNNCSYAFVVEESAFTFSPENLTNLRDVDRLPMVIDWAIGNGTCEEAQMNATGYACKSVNSTCYKPTNGYGYRCSCMTGYQGNPYLVGGCQDIDECLNQSLSGCEKKCVNTPGGFTCHCPKGYHGDGRINGKGCIRGESLAYKFATGFSLGAIVLLLSACWFHMELKKRSLIKMRQKFFIRNGGMLLQEKLTRRERSSPDEARVFSESELQKATHNFNNNMIIGRGGFGTVYKGLLSDNRIVAIKKSMEVDPNQIEQFINEVIVLSQINHRNVVKLLGCCLETQVPLLVYEFISNGTLFEHVHNKIKARFLSWDMRLKIATETAGVLSYLHSSASTPIIHRDVKTANILLDRTYTAKVSDFGASKLVPLDQTQSHTIVQGTLGYLDPEYLQTNQLTEKSDVYSFGVVLVELLTGMKVLSYDRPEDEISLANYFLSVMKKKCLFDILEDNVAKEGNKEQITKVAELARSCLHVKGDDRPTMKEVAMELEGLRVGVKHARVQYEHNMEDMEFMQGDGFSSFTNSSDASTSVGLDSLKDHAALPEDGGR